MTVIRPNVSRHTTEVGLKKVAGGYEFSYGDFRGSVEREAGGQERLLKAEVSLKGSRQAWCTGGIKDDCAEIKYVYPDKSVPKSKGMAGIGALLIGVEAALKSEDVQEIEIHTHPKFGRFLSQMGYKEEYREHPEGVTLVNMRKRISAEELRLPNVLRLHEKTKVG